ncbi:MAG: selenide, water dikinase SelD [Deltaproteobacteria bacterium]|nr:selenide, water dikinase SelD [Deltaproteobacteria bacterium]
MLLHGIHKDDDAAVVRMPDGKLLASTVDVFTPVVDDPYRFGAIGAANSLSDIYAMGGVPRFALSVLAYPPALFSPAVPAAILQGAVDKAWEAGLPLAGGHTLRTSEVLFGLAVVGDFPGGRVLEKGGALPGDRLVLTKPLGLGVLTTALKRGMLDPEGIDRITSLMSALNDRASRAAVEAEAHACTDVTGFGFLGHLLEMVQASGCRAVVDSVKVPMLPGAFELADRGVVPGGSLANLEFVRPSVQFDESVQHTMRVLLADAQTSGGLLVALAPDRMPMFAASCDTSGLGYDEVGSFEAGDAGILVR